MDFSSGSETVETNTEDNCEKMADFNLSSFREFIPDFDGQSKDLNGLIFLIDKMNSALADDQKETLLDQICFKLKGKAFTVYEQNISETWEDLKVALESKFGASKTINFYMTELQGVKQQQGENIKEYADRVG